MSGQKGYQWEILQWRLRQLRFRRKYKGIPPGFISKEAERDAVRQWMDDMKKFKESQEYRILSGYHPLEEPFVGRKAYLKQIQTAMESKRGPVVLYGIGGIGKSALARAYVKMHRSDYDHILFLSFNTNLRNMICDDYNVHISNLQYSKERYGSKNRYFGRKCEVLSQIAQGQKLLVVIDDCNTSGDKNMEKLFSISCDYLVTTRINPEFWRIQAEGIYVQEIKEESEWELFTECYQTRELLPEDKQRLRSYREKVQGHTLKMMLKVHNLETDIYNNEDFERDLFQRFSLKKGDKQLLMYLSIMPVQGIPLKLFRMISHISNESVERLVNFLLVQKTWNEQWKDEMLSLHPIISKAASHVFCPSPLNCDVLIQGLENYLNGEAFGRENTWARTYSKNQSLEPYIFAFKKAFPRPVPWLATAFDEIVTFLWIQGYFQEAEQYSLAIFHAVEEYYGDHHQLTGQMALRTAAVYHNSMRQDRARTWYLKAMHILKSCKKFNLFYEYHVSQVYSKVSRLYRFEGDYEKAMELIEESIAHIKKFGQDMSGIKTYPNASPESTYCYCLLEKAKILFCMGRLGEAEAIGRKALEEIYKVASHGFFMNEFQGLLAEILIKKKEYEQACRLVEQMLERAVRFRGESFKDVLVCREMLADIYLMQDRNEEALDQYNIIITYLQKEYPYQEKWIKKISRKISFFGNIIEF